MSLAEVSIVAVTVFLSAVSKEFHDKDPRQPQAFESYRHVLAQSLNRLGPGYPVIGKETLAQGFSDLLGMLDDEVGKSDVVVHLVGEMAGDCPEAVPLRRLRERHPEFLAHEPELAAAIGDGQGIGFTQWEFYLAVQHGKHRLTYIAEPSAPRSPLLTVDDQQRASQAEHVRRLKLLGEHPEPFTDQRDLALKVVISVVRHGLGPATNVPPPTPELVQAARDEIFIIVREIAEGLRPVAKDASQAHDPAGVEAYLRTVDDASLKREVDRRTTLELVRQYVDETRHDSETDPTADNLYELAFAELAMGNYPAAMTAAQQAVDSAREQMTADPANSESHREEALNAYLFLHKSAQLAHRHAEAIAPLEQGGALIDPDREPVLWADYHETLAEDYLAHTLYSRAKRLIDQIIDIREDHQGEGDPALPMSLMLWCRLLDAEANYQGVIGVAARAERLFDEQIPPEPWRISAALSWQATAFQALGRYHEAEPLIRRALAIGEQSYGAKHPTVARDLNNLALLLLDTNRLVEAEPLIRRALAIDEQFYGAEHPNVARDLNNLALLLQTTNRLAEAEPLYRRALAIEEQSCGPEHPKVARGLTNLAALFLHTNRLAEAESLMRRGLAIEEQSKGAEHPDVALQLYNLAALLQDTNRLLEAEPLMRRALAISEQSYGAEHPHVALGLAHLACLLRGTERLTDAVPLMRRAISLYHHFATHNGHEHPHWNTALSHYRGMLQATGLSEADVEAAIREAMQD